MIELFINGYKMDLKGDEVIAADYSISPIADISTRDSVKSIEFTLPRTNNNLSALQNPNVILNSSTLPYSLNDCYLLIDGIDMNIQKAQIISDEIRIKLFGGNITFYSLIKDGYLSDIDFSDLDHTVNWTNISAALNTTSNYIYPIIDYGALVKNLNEILVTQFANLQLSPAVFVHSVIQRIVEANGYTLIGDVSTDENYLKLMIPFSNADARSLTDEEMDSIVGFQASKIASNQTIAHLASDQVTFDVLDSGDDFVSPSYTAPETAYYTFYTRLKVQNLGGGTFKARLYSKHGADPEVLLQESNQSSGASPSFKTLQWNEFKITAGDEVYVRCYNDSIGGANLTILNGLDAFGVSNTHFLMKSVADKVSYGDTWDIALNLPKMKQSELLKFILQEWGALLQVNENDKTVDITKFSTLLNNRYTDNRYDWSLKIDNSEIPVTTFDASKYGQTNHCTYKDDEGLTKPEGTDYDIIIPNSTLQKETDLFTAPFAATVSNVKLLQALTIARINILSFTEDRNKVEPRILISDPQEVTQITFKYWYPFGVGTPSTLGTATEVNVPYFIDASKSFQLGWKYSIENLCNEFVDMILTPKQLKQLMRLTPIDINLLDFFKPVWIEKYGSWFYISNINQFKFTSKESTIVELCQLPE